MRADRAAATATGAGGRPQPSRPAGHPEHPSATTARRQSAGRHRLQATAAYPGEVQRRSRGARTLAVKGIPSELTVRRTEIGCSRLQP